LTLLIVSSSIGLVGRRARSRSVLADSPGCHRERIADRKDHEVADGAGDHRYQEQAGAARREPKLFTHLQTDVKSKQTGPAFAARGRGRCSSPAPWPRNLSSRRSKGSRRCTWAVSPASFAPGTQRWVICLLSRSSNYFLNLGRKGDIQPILRKI
jgi:hypothetical protein